MSIENTARSFDAIFGNKNTAAAPAAASGAARAKAQFWLNIGYQSDVMDPETKRPKFISLPLGIPLDTQEALPTNSRNMEFAQMQAARNDLLEQLNEAAKSLKPGEEYIICMDQKTGLAVQLRRVNDDVASITCEEGNPFARKLFAVPAAQ